MTQTWIRWLPVYSSNSLMGLLMLSVAIAVGVRLLWGRSLIGRRWFVWLLRCASISVVVGILFGPTWVEQKEPLVSRPKILFLFDGSSSMKLGAETSRWQDALSFVEKGIESTSQDAASDCQSFRFGHRLGPLSPTKAMPSTIGASYAPIQLTAVGNKSSQYAVASIPSPDATDSRLADALRELSSRIDTRDTAGLVLLSDGRVRGSESVEQLASLIGKRKIPIHVVPVGNSTGTGDVAIVSMVTQPRVRKYTENEVQVFLRSFGMAGKNTTVRIVDADSPTESASSIASVPIVLTGNAQSVSLLYNIADQPRNFRIIVDPIEGELTNRNNDINVKIGIDRTRVRVLYVEGSSTNRGFFTQIVQDAFGVSRPETNEGFTVVNALREDVDIECNFFESTNGNQPPRRVTDSTGSIASASFPETRSELFSYDCIIFSNVGPDILETEQQEMIAQWLEGRGSGMIITGADAIQRERWQDTPLMRALPILSETVVHGSDESLRFRIKSKLHPIWKLLNESSSNDRLLESIPALRVATRGIKAKPGADLLATLEDSGEPMIVAQRFGRGRVLLAAPSLAGAAGASLHMDWGPQGKKSASKLWRNMVYWATEGSSIGRRRVTVEADKRFYRPGDSMTFKAVAYDESARRTTNYRLWSMFEPLSIEDASLFAPAMWPEGLRRDSGETSPRIAWGEEIPLQKLSSGDSYGLVLNLNETTDGGQGGLRMELTAYESEGTEEKSDAQQSFGHGTQVDSMSTEIHILSDPFEQQNPLPNHDLLIRIANLSGGKVLGTPMELAQLLQTRPTIEIESIQSEEPAWSRWWLWCLLGILISSEWIVRRLSGFA
jgi:uncharacterized membrane protein